MADDQAAKTSTDSSSVSGAKARAGEAASEVREKAEAAADKARRKVSDAAEATKEQAGKVAAEAKRQTADVRDKVREGAQSAKERVQAEAERGFERGKSRVVTQIHGVAEAFRRTGEQLREEEQSDLAGYTDKIAEQVDKVSHYLDDKGLRGAVSDLEGFARQRPALFVGGALAVGLVAARFLRSSGHRR